MAYGLLGCQYKFIISLTFVVFLLINQVACFHATTKIKTVEERPIGPSLNRHPVILVHGILGWGRSEMFGFRYFGALKGDLQNFLRGHGFEVHTAAVGPVSSSWDRACELYAQIKGGTVDYGEVHAREHNHSRYGRYYKGFFPEWGTLDHEGNYRKIHFLAHSLGGPTVRVLSQLLSSGNNQSYTENDTETHSLFAGGKKEWIQSITTFSSPHDGSTLADGFASIGQTVKNSVLKLANVIGMFGQNASRIYDFKLDQFGITPQQKNETIKGYFKRVSSSPLFNSSFKDTSLYDLSTQGSSQLNSWIQSNPYIYYYSYSTYDTYESWGFSDWSFHKVHVPRTFSMILPLQPMSYFIGGLFTIKCGMHPVWQKNDGAVNSISTKAPTLNSTETNMKFNGSIYRGTWMHVNEIKMDHLAVVGWSILRSSFSTYLNHLHILLHSEKAEEQHRRLNDGYYGYALPSHLYKNVMKNLDILNSQVEPNTLESIQEACQVVSDQPSTMYCNSLLRKAKENRILFHVKVALIVVFSILVIGIVIYGKRYFQFSRQHIHSNTNFNYL